MTARTIATGHVAALNRWPVKSAAGEAVEQVRVDGRGVGGDRTHSVIDLFQGALRVLSARGEPRLLAWSASYGGVDVDPAAPPEPLVTGPEGRAYAWSDPALTEAVSAHLGRPVLLHREVAGQQDVERSVLITVQSTLAGLEAEMGQPVDVRRFRTNVHAVLDCDAFAEVGWEGRRLTIGEAELELLQPCLRCAVPTRHPDNLVKWAELMRQITRAHGGLLGIYARPLGAATIHVGDPVLVR